VSPFNTGRSASDDASMSDRARALAQQALPQARQVGTTAVQGVKTGVEGVKTGVEGVLTGVEGARGWAAPRLHDAADALTASVAPKVSSALHNAANTVEPSAPARTGLRRLLNWKVLFGIGAAVAAAGAAAAIAMRQRYESATLAASDAAENVADAAETVADKASDVAGQLADNAADTTKTQEVNGQVPHTTRK